MILVGKAYYYPVGITNSFQQDLSLFFSLSLYVGHFYLLRRLALNAFIGGRLLKKRFCSRNLIHLLTVSDYSIIHFFRSYSLCLFEYFVICDTEFMFNTILEVFNVTKGITFWLSLLILSCLKQKWKLLKYPKKNKQLKVITGSGRSEDTGGRGGRGFFRNDAVVLKESCLKTEKLRSVLTLKMTTLFVTLFTFVFLFW